MARQFGSYSPSIPLGATWEESIALVDEKSQPIDLTGYAVRAQLRVTIPTLVSGEPTTAPIVELTTPAYYLTPPAWPVVEGFIVPDPVTGVILLSVPPAATWLLSPSNSRVKLVWDVRLVNPTTGYTIPVVQGAVLALQARTV